MIVENVMVIENVYSSFLKVCLLGRGRREDITGVNVVQSSLAFHGFSTSQFRKFAELSQQSNALLRPFNG
jgi:hypothetical protein